MASLPSNLPMTITRVTLPTLLILLLSACTITAAPKDVPAAELAAHTPEVQDEGSTQNPLTGLTFRAGDTLWQVDNAGKAIALSRCARGAALSPDHIHMLYTENEHIWLVDLQSCETEGLTDFSENVEVNPQFWWARPDVIVFGVNPEFHAGLPGVINLDGSGYAVLDRDVFPNALPALSPDGHTLAYAAPNGPVFFNLTTGIRSELDVRSFGLDPATIARMDSPAWAADGSKLAWNAGIYTDANQEMFNIALLILDLQNGTQTLIHPYEPIGRGGWPQPPVWSPDGHWLILNMWQSLPEDTFGYWVVAADGSEEHVLRPENAAANAEQASPPIWKADSSAVAFSYANTEPNHYFVTIGDWTLTPLPIPADAVLLDWIDWNP